MVLLKALTMSLLTRQSIQKRHQRRSLNQNKSVICVFVKMKHLFLQVNPKKRIEYLENSYFIRNFAS